MNERITNRSPWCRERSQGQTRFLSAWGRCKKAASWVHLRARASASLRRWGGKATRGNGKSATTRRRSRGRGRCRDRAAVQQAAAPRPDPRPPRPHPDISDARHETRTGSFCLPTPRPRGHTYDRPGWSRLPIRSHSGRESGRSSSSAGTFRSDGSWRPPGYVSLRPAQALTLRTPVRRHPRLCHLFSNLDGGSQKGEVRRTHGRGRPGPEEKRP